MKSLTAGELKAALENVPAVTDMRLLIKPRGWKNE